MKCLFGRALSPSIYFLLAILQLLQYCCSADAGSIDVSPVTQRANLSDIGHATFYCRASTSRNTKWSINNEIMNSGNYSSSGYMFSEVIVAVREDGDIVHDMYLEVPTTVGHNGTVIQCVVVEDNFLLSEPPALLIVQGGPAAPVVSLTVVNSSLLSLHWEAPFTWPYTSIHHYTVSANNSLSNWNRTEYVETSMQIPLSSILSECAVYHFSVVANNELANGMAGVITGGFPIAPRLPADVIEKVVTFTMEQVPIVTLMIKLPMVCAYQRVRYWVTLNSPEEKILQDGPYSQLYGETRIVKHEYTLINHTSINFVHASVKFSLQNDSLTAEKNFTFGLIPGTGAVVVTASGLTSEQVVLITAISGAVLLIAIVFTMVLAAVVFYRRRGRFGAGRCKSPPMVTNPIYEGQSVYETIDPRFRPVSLTSTFALAPPAPTSARPPIESPYVHTPVDPSYASPNPSLPLPTEEAYTLMASAGGVGKHSSDSDDSNLESNLDHRPPEVARYVPEPSFLASEC